jgi:hypothetical protein
MRVGRRRLWFAIATVVGVVTAIALASEVSLRARDYHFPKYWIEFEHVRNEPTMNVPDPILGWRPAPGNYVIPPYVPGGSGIKTTVLPDGARSTGPASSPNERPVLLIGGSLAQGHALADEETFGWKLQALFPDRDLINLGVMGYGTYQSVLMLEEYFAADRPDPDLVIYAMADHHEFRNVASLPWLFDLSRLSRRGVVALPYCLIDDDELSCHAPEAYPSWALDRSSRLVNLVKTAYLKREYVDRESQRRLVTEKLLQRMRTVTEANGAKLWVVMLWMAREHEHYAAFLREQGFHVADCVDARVGRPDMSVPGEGHPNGTMHSIWSRCIAGKIAALR